MVTDAPCPLCGRALSGWAEVAATEAADPTRVVDCPSCGRLHLDPPALAVLGLAEPDEVAAVASNVAGLRAGGDRAVLVLRPELFVGAGI